MDPEDSTRLFSTTDVDLAALLSCHNIHHIELRRGDGVFAEFVYRASDALESLVASWGRGEPCLVDARGFGRTRRTLMKAAQRGRQ